MLTSNRILSYYCFAISVLASIHLAAQIDDEIALPGNFIATDSLPVAGIDSVIILKKNTNRNQVHYGVNVDDNCRPNSRKPVNPYWREYEKGEQVKSKLLLWEITSYGVRQPKEVSGLENGGSFAFNIRGLPHRVIRLETFKQDGICGARAYTEIANQVAVFQSIEIEVSGWTNVHRVEIFGVSVESLELLSEVTHRDRMLSPTCTN